MTKPTAVIIELDEERARKECLALNLKAIGATANWRSGFWIIRDGPRLQRRTGRAPPIGRAPPVLSIIFVAAS